MTSSLAALALAHGFVPDRGGPSAQLQCVIHVDFGRLGLGLTVKSKTKPNSIRGKRAEGFWGYFSEQVAYGLLAVAALSGSLAFVVLS